MTRTKVFRCLLMALCCLGVCGKTAAQCGAWILWREQFTANTNGVWTIEDGAPNFELCAKRLKERVDRLDKLGYRMLDVAPPQYFVYFDKADAPVISTRLRYVCLPESIIDPRGKEQR